MKSDLGTILKINKIAKIMCTVLFVMCIVGIVLSILSSMAYLSGFKGFDIGNIIKISYFIKVPENLTENALMASMAQTIIFCIAEASVLKLACNYLKRVEEDGTPFNVESANQFFQFGVKNLVIKIVASVISGIVFAIMTMGEQSNNFNFSVNVDIGASLVVMFIAIVYKCVAENYQEKSFPGRNS